MGDRADEARLIVAPLGHRECPLPGESRNSGRHTQTPPGPAASPYCPVGPRPRWSLRSMSLMTAGAISSRLSRDASAGKQRLADQPVFDDMTQRDIAGFPVIEMQEHERIIVAHPDCLDRAGMHANAVPQPDPPQNTCAARGNRRGAAIMTGGLQCARDRPDQSRRPRSRQTPAHGRASCPPYQRRQRPLRRSVDWALLMGERLRAHAAMSMRQIRANNAARPNAYKIAAVL